MHNTLQVAFDSAEVSEIKYVSDSGGRVVYSVVKEPCIGLQVKLAEVSGNFSAKELSHIRGLVEELEFVDTVRKV